MEIVEVESVKNPEIDEAFIQKITGKKQSFDDFKKDIEENLKAKMKKDLETQRENELMDKIFNITNQEFKCRELISITI